MKLRATRLAAASIALLLSSLAAPSASARTLRVPVDYPTIQAAINAARVADRVLVAPGRYVETIDFLRKRILVISEEGPEHTVIDANAQGSVVTFANGENHTSVLQGFRLTGGSGTRVTVPKYGSQLVGGGVFCDGSSSPTIKNCHFMVNEGAPGPGRAVFCGGSSSPRFISCYFSETWSSYTAFCLLVRSSRPVFLNNDFVRVGFPFEMLEQAGIHLEGNSISGSIYCIDGQDGEGGEFVITRNRFVDNSGISVFLHDAAGLRFEGNELVDNHWSEGAVVAFDTHSVEILDNTFVGNGGGGAYLRGGDRATFSGNIMVGNWWEHGGFFVGGIRVYEYSQVTIHDNLFQSNRGSVETIAALADPGSRVVIRDNVVSDNEYGVAAGGDVEVTGNVVSYNQAGVGVGGGTRLIDNTIIGSHHWGGVTVKGDALIIGNRITGNSRFDGGGGVYVRDGTVTLENNWIADNFSESGGGGIYMREGSLTLESNWIMNNSSESDGGAIFVWEGSLTLENNWIANNSSDGPGGGLCISRGTASLGGNLIANNSAGGAGGGMYLGPEAHTFRNNTIAHNQSKDIGGGAYVDAGAEFTDCIFWGNDSASEEHSQVGGDPTVSYSLVQGGWPGTGNIDADPLFLDPGSDYRLSRGSPCIEAGRQHIGPDVPRGRDLGGTPRLLDGDLDGVLRLDMGAYEFSHVYWDVTGDLHAGGLLEIEATGTPELLALLWVGQEGPGMLLGNFGELFVDLSSPWFTFDLGSLPYSAVVTVPTGLAGIEVQTQALALGTLPGTGNLSNPVLLRFE